MGWRSLVRGMEMTVRQVLDAAEILVSGLVALGGQLMADYSNG